MKTTLLFLCLFANALLFAQDEMPEIIKVGDLAPHFTISTIDGAIFDTKALQGKVLYLNFFATWCGPCMKEIPHVERDIWKTITADDFAMVAIGREHAVEEIKAFKAQKYLTMPLAADPDRAVYSMFAPQMIPRNIVIDKSGKIIYSKHGFDDNEFKTMIALIHEALKQ